MSHREAAFETVCSFDPGIDTSLLTIDEMIAFIRERPSLDKIRHAFSAANPPTRFKIREIPHALWESFVQGAGSDDERNTRAFMCGVECVYDLYQQDGTRLPSWSGSKTEKLGGGAQIDIMAASDLARFSPAERQEIGSVAHTHSFLPRRIGDCFRLPPSLVPTALNHRQYLPAASSPNEQEKNSEST